MTGKDLSKEKLIREPVPYGRVLIVDKNLSMINIYENNNS